MTAEPHNSSKVYRILLECTETYFTDRNTGIERVVRNIAQNSDRAGRDLGVECRPVVRRGSDFAPVSWRPIGARLRASAAQVLTSFEKKTQAWRQTVIGRTLLYGGRRARKLLYPRSLARYCANSWNRAFSPTINPGAGDALVLLDAWWNPNAWPTIVRARENGARVGVVIYDLLPLTHPKYFRPDVTALFTSCLRHVLEQGDFFITISDTARDTLYHYAMQHGPHRLRSASFTSFRLGSTLDMVSRRRKIREPLRRAFRGDSDSQPYLTVGTIEPRKNHVLLIDAFDRIWETDPKARLVIVGRVGWLCESLITRIVQHPQYGKSLYMFNDLNDSELEFCYCHSKALLFPSHAEGFGLPVAEALRHGLPVMASDIRIHREVGSDYCAYFDNQAPERLCELIAGFQRHGQLASVRTPEEFEVPSWDVSTHEFISRCLEACQSDKAATAVDMRRTA